MSIAHSSSVEAEPLISGSTLDATSSNGEGRDRQQRQQKQWEAPPIPDHVLQRNAELKVRCLDRNLVGIWWGLATW